MVNLGRLACLSLAIVAARAFAADPTLVAAYSFDEGSGGTLVDQSGNVNNGTISGATWTPSGKNGGALLFNGSSNRVSVPSSASLNVTTAVTLEAWVYPTASQSGWRAIIQKETDAYVLHASNDAGALHPAAGATIDETGTFIIAPSAIATNTWTHIAQTYDGTALRLFVNGVEVQSAAHTGSIQVTGSPLWIGGNNPYGEFFEGRIDDARVYNRALTAAEITADMNTPVGTPAPDPTPPGITITTPTSATTYSTSTTPLTLGGTASDNIAVTGVSWSNDRGGSDNASGTTTWSVPSITLQSGANVITVTAVDAAGNSSTDTLTVTYTPPTGGVGLIAAYSFDEGSGAAVGDSSGNSNNGTISGTPSWTTQGKFGGALTFDGTSNRVSVPPSTSLNVTSGATLEAWVFPTANQSGWRAIIQKETDAYVLHASNDAGALRPAAGGTYGGVFQFISAPSAIAVDTWSHIAQTYDGTTLRLYVNGTLVTSVPRTGALQVTTSPMWMGGNNPYGEFFEGRIDDARVYNRALSAAEISTDMNTPVGGVSNGDSEPPTAPADLSASAVSTTQINLTWTPSTDNVGVANYLIERCQGTGCSNFAQIATPATASYNDTGRSPSTSYSYRVRAQDAGPNFSAYSTTASATTPAAPDTQAPTTPTNLSATAVSSTQINLSWTASTDNVGVANYLIERCQGAGCSNFAQIATPATASYNDTGRSPATSYSYRVRAQDAVPNFGAYSTTASATTSAAPDTQPPTAPSGLNVTAGIYQNLLSWTASTDNVGVTAYLIERCQGASCSSFAQIDTTAATGYTDSTAVAGISYGYRVRARDAVPNFSDYSNIGTSIPADCD